jgi:allantoin racemase
MRLLVVNPNWSPEITGDIAKSANRYARPDTEIVIANSKRGPEAIESFYDESLAIPGMLEVIRESQESGSAGYDGIIIAAFIDSGLYAAREITRVPVLGIGESALYMASMLGHNFSILHLTRRGIPLLEEMVLRYGFCAKCVSIEVIEIEVLDYRRNAEKTIEALVRTARRAMDEHRAEVAILGGSVLAGFDRPVEERLGIPVIDPTVAAVKFMEAICDYGKRTSKRPGGYFSSPKRKRINNYPGVFQLRAEGT